MADTARTRAALVTLFGDNVAGDISAQDLRDFMISTHLMTDLDQVVTVAKAGGQYTLIQSAIDSISDAASDKIYTVLVYPGEYDEAITLSDYVNIVAIDPKATKILRQVSDNEVECHCYLKITIETTRAQEYGLYTSNANTVITIDGNVSGGEMAGVGCGNGNQTINGNVTCIDGSGAFISDGIQTINGNVSASGALSVICYGGIQTINGNIASTMNNANGHCVEISNGICILQNCKLICTHADVKSIYAGTAQDVYCMNVWANRDDDANITQKITGGFNFDANVQ